MCEKYKDQMEIDIICGRQTIDAYSILGVYSLVGHVVSIEPQTDDTDLMEIFGEDLERIKNGKNWYVKRVQWRVWQVAKKTGKDLDGK